MRAHDPRQQAEVNSLIRDELQTEAGRESLPEGTFIRATEILASLEVTFTADGELMPTEAEAKKVSWRAVDYSVLYSTRRIQCPV